MRTAPFAAIACASALGVGIAASDSRSTLSSDVTLAVHFRLTDLEYKPIAGAPVRLTFGSDPDWQGADAGQRFVTDARGEYRFEAHATLDKKPRKLPTNFLDSLASREQDTDHLLAAAELDYAGFRWLYTADICRFPGGDPVMLDGTAVYTRDAKGRFTQKAVEDRNGWRMADLKGLMLTTPGHEPWNYMLQPDPADASGHHWTLDLAFKRFPAPIRR